MLELITTLSITAVAAFVMNALVDTFTKWYFSESVQQIVNMTLMVRDSLPPMVVEAIKVIAIAVGKTLHLVLHIAGQIVLAVKNILKMVVLAAKGFFVVLRGFNEIFDMTWTVLHDLPSKALTIVTDFVYTHPVPSARWHMLFTGLVLFTLVWYGFRRFIRWYTTKPHSD